MINGRLKRRCTTRLKLNWQTTSAWCRIGSELADNFSLVVVHTVHRCFRDSGRFKLNVKRLFKKQRSQDQEENEEDCSVE